jgi:hypothetical protein
LATTQIAKTLGEAVRDVADRLPNALVEDTEATAGASGSVTLGNVPIEAISGNNDHYNDLWAYIYKDTGAGQERFISDYVGSTRVATTVPNWTTTPDSTSNLIIVRGFRPSYIERVVREAIRQASQVLHPPLTDASLRIGNLIDNGHFEYWDSGSAVSAGSFIFGSDGWAVRGTGATGTREATFARNSSVYTQYSGKLVSDGSNEAYFERLIPNWALYASKSITIKCWVYTTTADRVRIRLQDGVTTITDADSSDHTGTAGWQELTGTFTVNAAPIKLALECYISSGGAVTAYFDDARITPAAFSYDLRIPAPFTYLKELRVESGTEGVFDQTVPREMWFHRRHSDGHPYISFDPQSTGEHLVGDANSLGILVKDRHLLLQGQGYRTDTMAAATNIERPHQYVVARAVADIASTRMHGGSDESRFWVSLYDRYAVEAEHSLRSQANRREAGTMRVRG